MIGPAEPAPEGFDRVLRTPGPSLAGGAWRSRPLPVDDRLFGDPTPSARPPRALFLAQADPAARVDPHARQARPRRRPLHPRAHRRRARRRAQSRRRRHRAARRHRAGLPVPDAAPPRRRPPAAERAPAARLRPGAGHRLPRDRLARPPADAPDPAALAAGRLRARADPRTPEGRGAPRVARVAADRPRPAPGPARLRPLIPWQRDRRQASRRRPRGVEDVRAAAGARADAQGARAAPAAPDPHRHPARAARRQCRRRARRVLRDRRAQRLGQVDAAEVPGRDLRRRPRRDLPRRPAVRVHRARRRLQHGPAGARQRDHQRDDARAQPARGAPARGHRRRLRRARPVRRPQAQELLVRDARAARVRGDDPGRRRHPADRRGARRRRRRVPAEVLRRVRAHPRGGQDDPARHPRHGRRAPLLRPRDAARAAAA